MTVAMRGKGFVEEVKRTINTAQYAELLAIAATGLGSVPRSIAGDSPCRWTCGSRAPAQGSVNECASVMRYPGRGFFCASSELRSEFCVLCLRLEIFSRKRRKAT